ncbi:MAG: aldolase/citrate lyase family protein [Planctomycetaceae bacterium]|nr:aldolase/citrate lyase family protein [Planctomycetaceae bacterium]
MKTSALKAFRRKLAASSPVYGLWVTLEAPSVTEIAVALGLDWVVIDAEHGHLDWKEIVEHLRATVRSDTVALVRVASLDIGLIKRALDLGADGVVIPWVESAEQFRQAVAFARYPPEGLRGIGAERATCWGQCFVEHTAEANENVLVIPIIETVRTMRQVPLMTQVDGAEVFLFGPADYSSTAGYRGQWEGPGVAEQILAMKDVIRRAGQHCGVLAASEADIAARSSQGFQMIGLGFDTGLLIRSLRSALQTVQRSPRMIASLESDPGPVAPLERPPESMRPDRPEVMNAVGSGQRVELSAGVSFECLVGRHNQARKLTTGWVTFAPEAALPYHTHPFTESITLLQGAASVEIEGRKYVLKRMDNVTIPAGLAHSARNLSARDPAVFQVALATDNPVRTLVDRFFSKRTMPEDSTGHPGAERVNRFATAKRFAAGPNTEFIDFFNETLMPGLEMSGGYGLFAAGGRLPAHVHDFDESICIISGEAMCVVEGRRYRMSGGVTALQPRGRVHYFINESKSTMEMLWVYAGPKPERIVVQERCATEEGNPWR